VSVVEVCVAGVAASTFLCPVQINGLLVERIRISGCLDPPLLLRVLACEELVRRIVVEEALVLHQVLGEGRR